MERFVIDRKIGSGAQATTYLAHFAKDPAHQVVLKRVAVEQVSLSEMAILHRLNHPAVIRCYDAFTHDGDLFLVLQYADGGDLEKLINSAALRHVAPREVLPLPVVERMFIQLCLGLQFCHDQRTLHRDLKTANILIMKDLSRALLGDFGVAKTLSQNQNVASTMVGTPMTLAPETVNGQGYSYGSDVWALGCVLYEMLTFKKPFPQSNLAVLIAKVSNGDYEPLPNSVPSHFRRIIKGMLQVDLNKRYSVQEALGELSRKAVLTVKHSLQEILDAATGPNAQSPAKEQQQAREEAKQRPGRRQSEAPAAGSPTPPPAPQAPPAAAARSPQKKRDVDLATGPLDQWVRWKQREFEEIDAYLAMYRDDAVIPTQPPAAGGNTPQAQLRRMEESDDPLSPQYVKPRTPPNAEMNAARARRLLPSPQAIGEKGGGGGGAGAGPPHGRRADAGTKPIQRDAVHHDDPGQDCRPPAGQDASAQKRREREAQKRAEQREELHRKIAAGRQARSLDRDEFEALGQPHSNAVGGGGHNAARHLSPSPGRQDVAPAPPASAPAAAGQPAHVGGDKPHKSTRDMIREQRKAAKSGGSASNSFDVEIVLPGNLQHLLPKQQ